MWPGDSSSIEEIKDELEAFSIAVLYDLDQSWTYSYESKARALL